MEGKRGITDGAGNDMGWRQMDAPACIIMTRYPVIPTSTTAFFLFHFRVQDLFLLGPL